MTKDSPVCRDARIRFAEDLSKADREERDKVWPQIEQARKKGLKTYFRGPFGYINGQRITPPPLLPPPVVNGATSAEEKMEGAAAVGTE